MDGRRSWIALLVAMLLTLSAATACTSPSAPPPAPATPFVPAPPSTAQFPAQVIDLANWYLTLPTGETSSLTRSINPSSTPSSTPGSTSTTPAPAWFSPPTRAA